ncbi:MAG: hypothetical protein ACE5E7_04330 [Anaerolineae bacterium]
MNEIPVFVGEMTFNEGNNRGFTKQYVVSWSSEDLLITIDGNVSGTFVTTYEGPPSPFPVFKDILFFQVQARYVYPRYGDIVHKPLIPVIPLVATQSNGRSAQFIVDTSFLVPPLVANIDEGLPLKNLELTLTWVRVYISGQELYVRVFPGDANRYSNKPRITFNQPSQRITGRFGYYEVLPESTLMGGRVLEPNSEFEYYTWLRENITW